MHVRAMTSLLVHFPVSIFCSPESRAMPLRAEPIRRLDNRSILFVFIGTRAGRTRAW